MPERTREIREKDRYLNLAEVEEETGEQLDEQVQRAQEQLLQLKRQQELIERQKRELEELSRRQEQLHTGRAEMIEQYTRAMVVLERETYDSQKRVEQLRAIYDSFVQHLANLESINPKAWENADLNKELNKALSTVDDAREEFARGRALINANTETSEEVLPSAPVHTRDGLFSGSQDFMCWLWRGFAFTLPLLALGLLLLLSLYVVFGN